MSKYQKSRYTVVVPVSSGEEKLIALYHTMARTFVLLTEEMWRNLLATNTPVEDADTLDSLLKQGILVKAGTDETSLFDVWFQQYVNDYSHIRSKIMVTRLCNNACLYCILDPEAQTMSSETARSVDAFYIQQIALHHPKRVTDAYSGGEPLLNLNVICESAARRYYFCLGKGIEYGFNVTTNGTLLTAEVVERLKRVGLTEIRVSMAGPADVHDRLRPAAGGEGTYETIMKNLEAVSRTALITIECQYDAGADDGDRIPEMMDDIISRNIKISDISFTPIMEKRGNNDFQYGVGEPGQMLYLQEAAAERGLSTNRDAPSNACQADFRAFFVFDTDGSIIPCSSLQCGEMAYGHVGRGVDFVAETQFLARKLPDQCRTHCQLLPMCMGGCRLQALTRDGDFNGIDCHYGTYYRLLEAWMERKALAILAETAE